MQLTTPPEPSTPQGREAFFRHVLQDEGQPLESRVQGLQALIAALERESHESGRRAEALQRDVKAQSASDDTPLMYRAVRVAWDTLRRDGQVSVGRREAMTDEQCMAFFGAIVARNALEDIHADHIPDVRMKEFNTVLRNAIFTALHAARSMMRSERAAAWVTSQLTHIPPYWEEPELLDGYVKSTSGAGRTAAPSSSSPSAERPSPRA